MLGRFSLRSEPSFFLREWNVPSLFSFPFLCDWLAAFLETPSSWRKKPKKTWISVSQEERSGPDHRLGPSGTLHIIRAFDLANVIYTSSLFTFVMDIYLQRTCNRPTFHIWKYLWAQKLTRVFCTEAHPRSAWQGGSAIDGYFAKWLVFTM